MAIKWTENMRKTACEGITKKLQTKPTPAQLAARMEYGDDGVARYSDEDGNTFDFDIKNVTLSSENKTENSKPVESATATGDHQFNTGGENTENTSNTKQTETTQQTENTENKGDYRSQQRDWFLQSGANTENTSNTKQAETTQQAENTENKTENSKPVESTPATGDQQLNTGGENTENTSNTKQAETTLQAETTENKTENSPETGSNDPAVKTPAQPADENSK